MTPQALEWLAFDPESDTRGSLVAVGAMDPLIQVLVLVMAVLVVAVLVVLVLGWLKIQSTCQLWSCYTVLTPLLWFPRRVPYGQKLAELKLIPLF